MNGTGRGSFGSISGHVFRVQRTRGPVWYAKYRLPDGRQVQKKARDSMDWTGKTGRGLHDPARGAGLAG
jgi:hypothetical protein